LKVYRICKAKFPKNDGKGASVAGGRWNHIGTQLVYSSESPSLSQLEVLVHSAILPSDRVLIEIEIPDAVLIETITDAKLPKDWKANDPLKATKDIGTKWARRKSSAVLSVPSSVEPGERNYLLNPRHPDFAKIKFHKPQPKTFDARLK
jgi:RES domain-containing protein